MSSILGPAKEFTLKFLFFYCVSYSVDTYVTSLCLAPVLNRILPVLGDFYLCYFVGVFSSAQHLDRVLLAVSQAGFELSV